MMKTPFALTACDQAAPHPPVTSIVRVEVEPNPVTVGDTATFTCVITDSLDSGFKYLWDIEGDNRASFATQENQFKWIAPSTPDTFSHKVAVSKPESSKDGSQAYFDVYVIADSTNPNQTTR